MKKKLLFLMCLCLLSGINASAYDAYIDGIYYNFSGDEATVTYGRSTGVYSGAVVIPESVTYNGKTYSVTTIGTSAFRDCSHLESITIPSSLKRVQGVSFNGCTSLNKIIVSDIAAWCGIIYEGYGSFTDASVDFPMGLPQQPHLYSDENTPITEIVIPEGVTRIEPRAFRDVWHVTSITIPNSVTYIGQEAFRGMGDLTSINIPEGITSIERLTFTDCYALPSINIPNSVTSIGNYAFNGCGHLASISIGRGLKSIGEFVFEKCNELTYVTLLCDSVSTWFKGMTSIQRVVIGNSVTSIAPQAFLGCSNLSTFIFGNNLSSIGREAFDGTAWDKNQPGGVVYTGKFAYKYKGWLTGEISINEGTIGIVDYAFSGCSLNSVILPEGLTTIGNNAFERCYDLASITIPSTLKRVKTGAFSDCSSLSKVIVKDIAGWCGIVYDGDDNNADFPLGRALHLYSNDSTEITEVVIPEGVTRIEKRAFRDAKYVTSVTIPSSVTSIEEQAFRGMHSLTSINIPEGITSIEPFTFQDCKVLPSITIPNSVTSIGSSAFGTCALTSITIPNSVTNIDSYAFEKNDSLTSVIIGSGVETIGDYAFQLCLGLTDVYCYAENVPNTGGNAFNQSIALATLHVPASALDAYSAVSPWNGFSTIEAVDNRTEQTLELAELPTLSCGDAAYTLPEKTEQGLPLTWGIADASIASISGYQLSPLSGGTTTVTATQAGDSNYLPFTKSFTLTVTDETLLNNKLYAETVKLRAGASKTFCLKLDNTLTFIACEFYLQLPDGVRIETDEDGYLMAELVGDRINRHSLEADHVGNGLYHFLCYSNKNYAFKGQSGDFITITVACDEGLVADTYTATVKDIIFSDQDKHQVDLLDRDFDIIVTDIIPGDANGDEKINVMDIVEIVGHIMGNPSDAFVFAAADMDENGTINVMDLVNVVSLIMTNANQQAAGTPRRRSAAPMRADATTDALTVADFSIAAGETKEVSMVLDNPTNEFIAFEFWMSLPDGVRIAYDEEGELMATLNASRSDGHDFIVEEPNGDGIYHFLCYSGRNKRLKGNSGELINLTLTCAGDATVGNATGTIYDMIFSDPDKNEVNLADATFSVAITEAGDGRTVLDENSTTVPAMATDVDVRVKRTIKANEWSTICLPFAMTEAQVKEAFGNDVLLGDFVGAESEFDEADNVTGIAVSFDEASAIEANHPYVIKVSQPVEEFTLDGVDIVADEDEAYIEFDNGKSGSRRVVYSGFYGTYHAGTVLDEFTLFLNDNKFWYSTGQTKMKAFRAYFAFLDVLTDVENAAGVIEFKMNLDDATGLRTIDHSSLTNDHYYNLAGQRVGRNYKGVVVTKGKKFVK